MKVKAIFLTLLLFTVLLVGCAKENDDGANPSTSPAPTTAPATTTAPGTTTTPEVTTTAELSPTTSPDTTDVVTTASIVNTEDAFLNAISDKGTWIIAILEDMTIDKDIALEGEFKNGKQDDAGKDIIQRKVALYSQDENRTITAKYVLTAPKFTISSPQASIQHGTFVGDLYVNVADFKLIDAIVDGNIYFASEEFKTSFNMDETSSVTGKQEVQ
ncbi:MAG: hypothetical protein ACYDEX_04220 [Mobilitalea sp.]